MISDPMPLYIVLPEKTTKKDFYDMEFDIPIKAPDVISYMISLKAGQAKPDIRIDREGLTVKDVVLTAIGEAKGWGFHVDTSFLTDLVAYAKKELKGRVQSNMGHRWDANFFQFGRFSNIRLSADKTHVLGDLKVYAAANESPVMRGMVDWFFNLAEEDPRALSFSISAEHSGYYQIDSGGKRIDIKYLWDKAMEDEPAYVKFKSLISCDVVDNGALTDGLFSAGMDSGIVHRFQEITNAPGFIEFFRANESAFPNISNFYQEKYRFNLSRFFSGIFSNTDKMSIEKTTTEAPAAAPDTSATVEASAKPATDTPAAPAAAAPEAPATVEASAKGETAAPAAPAADSAADQIKALQDQNTALLARIAALEGKPAEEATTVATEDPATISAAQNVPLWEQNPVYKKALAFQAKA